MMPDMKNNKGFTLIEVVISLVVMAIIIGALLQAFETFSLKDSGAQSIGRLNFAANAKLEAVSSKKYSLITNEALADISGFTGFKSLVIAEYVSKEALDTVWASDSGYKRITVRVMSYLRGVSTVEVKGIVTDASN